MSVATDGAASMITSAGQAAQQGDARASKALFEQAVLSARAEGSAAREREASLGAAEMSWQVCARMAPQQPRRAACGAACLPLRCFAPACAACAPSPLR
jgi:hypothetical protein